MDFRQSIFKRGKRNGENFRKSTNGGIHMRKGKIRRIIAIVLTSMLLTSNVCISDTVFAEEVLSNTAPVATYEVVETPAAVSNTAAEPAAQITLVPAV